MQQNKHPHITAEILFNVKVTIKFYIAVTCNCFSLLGCTQEQQRLQSDFNVSMAAFSTPFSSINLGNEIK